MSPAGRRISAAGLALLAVGAGAVVVLAPPERCPPVTTSALRDSAAETVAWFVRNQRPDGTWLYEYDRDTGRATPDYNVVRHSGAVMGLYQAATAGIPRALRSADRGLGWSLERLVERDGWTAISYGGETSVGAVALLTAGLVERRLHTGDGRYDELLRSLGRFLVAQTEATGAVLAYYDQGRGRPVPAEYSKYYTGEAYWALGRLHAVFPDEDWGVVADRIGSYMATSRDDVEDYWPPLPDHWAAYGLAETVAFDDRPGGVPLTDGELAYARRQAGLFGAEVRWVSQQSGPWGRLVRGTNELRGGGYGVIGEALTGLWLVARAEDRMTDLRAPLADRAVCIAGLALRAQTDATEAADFGEPRRVRGAWFRDGVTRMDDQQHALSAVLRAIPILATSGSTREAGNRQAPAGWLWLVALVAAVNPCRAAFGVPRRNWPGRDTVRVAAVGGSFAVVAVLAAAFLGDLFFDAVEVSEPALRIAAGVVGAVGGVLAFVRRPPSPEPALPGWRAAIVPVAVPALVTPALVVLAVSAYADHGPALVAAGVAVGAGVTILLVATVGARGVSARVLSWAGRFTGALLMVTATLLVIDGIFAV